MTKTMQEATAAAGAAPRTITVEGEMLFGLAAQVAAYGELFEILADTDDDVAVQTDFAYPWRDRCDDWLGITWDDDVHQTNPIYHRLSAAMHELIADMLDAIVADPDEALVPFHMSRRELADAAKQQREWAERDAAKAETLASGDPGDD